MWDLKVFLKLGTGSFLKLTMELWMYQLYFGDN